MHHAAHHRYRTVSVGTARPIDLVDRLTRKALACAESAAETALRDPRAAIEPSQKSQDIVTELLASLDPSAGQIAHDLAALYLFVLVRLREGDKTRRPEPYRDAARTLTPLAEAWHELAGRPDPVAVSA